MRHVPWLLVVAGVVSVSCLASVRTVPANSPAVARTRWEYRIDNWEQVARGGTPLGELSGEAKEQHFLNGLAARGEEGWELVAVQGDGRKARYYFKRPK